MLPAPTSQAERDVRHRRGCTLMIVLAGYGARAPCFGAALCSSRTSRVCDNLAVIVEHYKPSL